MVVFKRYCFLNNAKHKCAPLHTSYLFPLPNFHPVLSPLWLLFLSFLEQLRLSLSPASLCLSSGVFKKNQNGSCGGFAPSTHTQNGLFQAYGQNHHPKFLTLPVVIPAEGMSADNSATSYVRVCYLGNLFA